MCRSPFPHNKTKTKPTKTNRPAPKPRARRQPQPPQAKRERAHRPPAPVRQPRPPKQLIESRPPTSPPQQAPAISTGSVGSKIGGTIGSFLGDAAQDLFSTLLGAGDYSEEIRAAPDVPNNSIMGTDTAAQAPIMHEEAELGSVRITHREFIRDQGMGLLFSVDGFFLNPTNAVIFPWMANIANQYERFRFLGIVFEFRTLSSTSSVVPGNPSQGSIVMATSYDSLQSAFTLKQNMLASLFATSCRPSDNMIHPVECKQLCEPLYMYAPAITAGGDPRLQSMGQFCIGTVAPSGATVPFQGVGELWVSYDVILSFPRRKMNTASPPGLLKFQDETKNFSCSNTSLSNTADGDYVYNVVEKPFIDEHGELQPGRTLGDAPPDPQFVHNKCPLNKNGVCLTHGIDCRDTRDRVGSKGKWILA